jgi:hypothetical protein
LSGETQIVDQMDKELRAVGECYPSNIWYNVLADEDGSSGGTAWQGEGFWKLHEIRYNVF